MKYSKNAKHDMLVHSRQDEENKSYKRLIIKGAPAGNRTRIACLGSTSDNHFTTDANTPPEAIQKVIII